MQSSTMLVSGGARWRIASPGAREARDAGPLKWRQVVRSPDIGAARSSNPLAWARGAAR